MGSEMLIMSLGLKAKDRFRVDEEWARKAFAEARRAIDAVDVAQLKKISGERTKSRTALQSYKQGLLTALDDVEAAALGNRRQAATVEGGDGIVLLLSGGMSWGDPPTELFDSMTRLLEADVIPDARWPQSRAVAVDLAEVRSQEAVKRALVVALAGNHSVVLIGPSGHGKTMLARAATAIRPIHIDEMTNDPKDPARARLLQQYVNDDIHIELPPVPYRELTSKRTGTDSGRVREQVEVAVQWGENHKDMSLSDSVLLLGKQAYDELGLSARAFTVAVRIARTIANLEQSERIGECHLAEAVQYRLLDRKF